jgi:hypothetical protein
MEAIPDRDDLLDDLQDTTLVADEVDADDLDDEPSEYGNDAEL